MIANTHTRVPARQSTARVWQIAKSNLLFFKRPYADDRRQAQGISKVLDRAGTHILIGQQRFVGCFADFADCLQARGCQHVPDPGRESNAIDRHVVRQFRLGINQVAFGHCPSSGAPAFCLTVGQATIDRLH
jgi:hypothetical protein